MKPLQKGYEEKKYSIMAPSQILKKVPGTPNLYWTGCCQRLCVPGFTTDELFSKTVVLHVNCSLPEAYALTTLWSSSLWLSMGQTQENRAHAVWTSYVCVCGGGGMLWPSDITPLWGPEENLLQWVTEEGRKHGCASAGEMLCHRGVLHGGCTLLQKSPPHTASHSFQRAQEMVTKIKAHEANEAPLHCLTYLESMLKGFRVNDGERKKK